MKTLQRLHFLKLPQLLSSRNLHTTPTPQDSRTHFFTLQNDTLKHIHAKLDSLQIPPTFTAAPTCTSTHETDKGRIYLIDNAIEADKILSVIKNEFSPLTKLNRQVLAEFAQQQQAQAQTLPTETNNNEIETKTPNNDIKSHPLLSRTRWDTIPSHIIHVLGFDTETSPNFFRRTLFPPDLDTSIPSTIQLSFGVPYTFKHLVDDWQGQLVLVIRIFKMCSRFRVNEGGLEVMFVPEMVPGSVKDVLENPKFLKVGLGASKDAKAVSKYFGVEINGVFDLDIVAKSIGLPTYSLSGIANHYTSETMPKSPKLFMINWDTKKQDLSLESIKYAARDARYGSILYHLMIRPPDRMESVETVKEVKLRGAKLKSWDQDVVATGDVNLKKKQKVVEKI
ncbi:hypothetical protein HK098_003024 [Nowakowskiella sp. JEL0407]|nr:hypothetical protein HK098_003024 [Nowakowskiella sp. JEL0407]